MNAGVSAPSRLKGQLKYQQCPHAIMRALHTLMVNVSLRLGLEKSGREITPTFRQLSFGSSRMLTVGLCVELD